MRLTGGTTDIDRFHDELVLDPTDRTQGRTTVGRESRDRRVDFCQVVGVRVGAGARQFLQFDPKIQSMFDSRNAIGSISAQLKPAVRVCGRFPFEKTELRYRYLSVHSLDPNGKARQGLMNLQCNLSTLSWSPWSGVL